MQYFQAVQAGKKRAASSQMKLFETAGFAMLTLTTKKVGGKFMPVGEEEYVAAIENEEGFIVVITDGGGFTKAQTKPVEREEALRIFEKLLARPEISEYGGEEIGIWTETFPVMRLSS